MGERLRRYGYDPLSKSLFSWNGDFFFEGLMDPPEGALVVPESLRVQYEMLGCFFMSGLRRDSIICRFDGDNISYMAGFVCGNHCVVGETDNRVAYELVTTKQYPLCICGADSARPSRISAICRRFPLSPVYVCYLVDGLAALGLLVSDVKEKPRRIPLCQPNISNAGSVLEEFDPKLAGDGMGRMANYLKRGTPVFNDMMRCAGLSPFYGRVLTGKATGTFIVRSGAVDRYFPTEPISLKKYAATSVPVEVRNTDDFSKDSGCCDETVVISASSDYIPDLPVFMNFNHLMSKRDFVATAGLDDYRKNMPVFAYNRAYKVDNVG